MGSVYLCSKTNSQMFTTCCDAAICHDQRECPACADLGLPEPVLDGHTSIWSPHPGGWLTTDLKYTLDSSSVLNLPGQPRPGDDYSHGEAG